ncbi:MAG: hypothetical protein MUP76_04890 [Acidimicrobiia bacterium]|nr:hypothetical protein [Acidimicrobiia bacterium]
MSKMTKLMGTILVLGLLLTACGGSDGYTDEIRAEFMAGCEPSAGAEFCGCALDEIEKNFSEDEFIQIGLDSFTSGTEEPPEELMAAMAPCLTLLGG